MYVCNRFFRIFSSIIKAISLKFCMCHGCLCCVTHTDLLLDYPENNRFIHKKTGFIANAKRHRFDSILLRAPVFALQSVIFMNRLRQCANFNRFLLYSIVSNSLFHVQLLKRTMPNVPCSISHCDATISSMSIV